MDSKLHIRLDKGQKLFFTSDLHFGHRNVLTFCNRPFSDIKDMSEKLIANWNSVVSESDIVFSLGDFCWFDSNTDIQRILKKLNGTIYLIPGNHDTAKGFRALPEHVTLLGDVCTVWVSGIDEDRPSKEYELYLSHCPMMTWPHKTRGTINFFGHIHSGPGSDPNSIDKDLPLWPHQQYDVGVDNNNYTPVEIRELFDKLQYRSYTFAESYN